MKRTFSELRRAVGEDEGNMVCSEWRSTTPRSCLVVERRFPSCGLHQCSNAEAGSLLAEGAGSVWERAWQWERNGARQETAAGAHVFGKQQEMRTVLLSNTEKNSRVQGRLRTWSLEPD